MRKLLRKLENRKNLFRRKLRAFYKTFVRFSPNTGLSVLYSPLGQPRPTIFRMNQLNITGNHLLLTEALKSLTQEKFDKLFRHAPEIVRINVELGYEENRKDRNSFTAKARIEIGGPDCVASATTDDLYKSIDELVRKLDKQLRRRVRPASAKGSDRLAA